MCWSISVGSCSVLGLSVGLYQWVVVAECLDSVSTGLGLLVSKPSQYVTIQTLHQEPANLTSEQANNISTAIGLLASKPSEYVNIHSGQLSLSAVCH